MLAFVDHKFTDLKKCVFKIVFPLEQQLTFVKYSLKINTFSPLHNELAINWCLLFAQVISIFFIVCQQQIILNKKMLINFLTQN